MHAESFTGVGARQAVQPVVIVIPLISGFLDPQVVGISLAERLMAEIIAVALWWSQDKVHFENWPMMYAKRP